MISDPRTSQRLWKSKEAALRDKLQGAYNSYQSTIGEIERITKKIANRLELEGATTSDLEAFLALVPKTNDKFDFRKRVRFGMNKKSVKILLEELDDYNKQLERFTEKSEKIETYRKTTKPSYATRFQRIQRYAKTLHDSLTVCWSCSCKSSHKTSLQLESRAGIFDSESKNNIRVSKTSFNVSFLTISDDGNGVPWLVQAAEICVEDDDTCLTPPLIASPKPGK
jgi:predicted  nucleic acid-binding Zn-ribbon protein